MVRCTTCENSPHWELNRRGLYGLLLWKYFRTWNGVDRTRFSEPQFQSCHGWTPWTLGLWNGSKEWPTQLIVIRPWNTYNPLSMTPRWKRYITPALIRWIKELLTAEAPLSIQELQQKPQFVKQKWSENSLEVKAIVARPNGSKLPIVAFVDSGCSGSAINETFVKENKLLTHDIPIPTPIYNTNGAMNKGGSISKFTMVELVIDDHSECLPLSITSLSTHAVFLGFDWLKTHNLEINWKIQKLTLLCREDHLPDLIPVEEEEEDIGYEKEEERLFWIDIESYIRATRSTDLAMEANKEKQKTNLWDHSSRTLPWVQRHFRQRKFQQVAT